MRFRVAALVSFLLMISQLAVALPLGTLTTTQDEYLDVDLAYLIANKQDFLGIRVRTKGTVRFYISFYMFEDFWLEASSRTAIPTVVRFAGLPTPSEGSFIEVVGIVQYSDLEGGFFYLNVSQWIPQSLDQSTPTISFFPREIYLDEQTRNFTVSVNIENLRASHRLGSVSVRLEYDSTLVSFVGDIRGDFLKDFDRYFLIEMDFPYIWLVNTPPITSFPEGNGTIWMCNFTVPVLVDTTIRLISDAVDVEGNVLIQNSSDYCHLVVPKQPEPLPTISLFPHEIYLDEQTRNFTVSVNIENLRASHRLVGVDFRLQTDLALVGVSEMIDGFFWKDFGDIFSIILSEMDFVLISILLLPDSDLSYTRFPEGNGTMAVVSFVVAGPANSTIYLISHAADVEANMFFQNASDHCHVYVTWNRADLKFDGKVDILDLSVFGKAFASRPGHCRWNWNVDIDGNQVIDIIDATKIANDFGKQHLIPLQTIEGQSIQGNS